MAESLIETAIMLAQRQIVALERGDFDAYFTVLPEYECACLDIEALPAEELRASRRELELLVLSDARARAGLAALKDATQDRIASLHNASRVASAYLPGSGPRIASRRQA